VRNFGSGEPELLFLVRPDCRQIADEPGFEGASRISLRVTRLAPTFEAAARFIFFATTATPSSRAAAADKTISWVSVSFAMVFSSCFDSIRCHQHDPAMA
jgi:hypothetical protein